MKNIAVKKLLFLIFLCVSLTYVMSSDITFKANVKTTSDESIPRVYLRIYIPGVSQAVDSMFTNDQGYIERLLTLGSGSYIDYTQLGTELITRKLSPNIISQNKIETSIEYNYQGSPEIYFTDISGKVFPNHSELSAGIYSYFLLFNDGMQSEVNRIVVTENCLINLNLVPCNAKVISHFKTSVTKLADVNRFYVEFIKDGFVTKKDTILIDAEVITRNYQLTTAAKPTANFTYSGTQTVGEPVVFDASTSVGANGENLVYSWDFDNNKKGQSVSIPHLYNSAGSYTVTLTVAGNYGATHSISKTVTIGSGTVPSGYTGVVKGYITDENQFNLSGVVASLVEGDEEALSDNTGKITLSNLPIGIPLHFKISKAGYVNQVVGLTIPSDTVEGLFFVVLKARNSEMIFSNAEYGGQIIGDDGATLNLPIDALLKPDGSIATGDVNVSVTPVDVAYETGAFPGTFNAFRTNGDPGVLLSFGVSEYHFQQDGEPLQLVSGKTATILIPIYTSGAQAGDEIPLWSINEDDGKWVEEGIGIVVESDDSPTGLAMKANVGHLSWWNCDDYDDPKPKDGICYKIECFHGLCYRVKVGCWVDGARSDDESKILPSDTKFFKAADERNEIPPVFEVREFLPETGKTLLFPDNNKIYIVGRAFTENGEFLQGTYTIQADDDADTFAIELFSTNIFDTIINIPLNTTLEYYLEAGAFMHFGVNLPERNAYRINLNSGSTIPLSGNFIVRDSAGTLNSGTINYGHRYAVSGPGQLIVTAYGNDPFDEGNFTIEVASPEPISIPDSLSDSLTVEKKLKFYSLKPLKNTVLISRFHSNENISSDRWIKFYSGIKLPDYTDYLYNKEGKFNSLVYKDSIYFYEICGKSTSSFVLITEEDTIKNISYGDTINSSLDYETDKDLYCFTGSEDDLVAIKCTRNNWDLSDGIFELWDTSGKVISSKNIEYYSYTERDMEIIYKLPADGKYTILIYSKSDQDGSYQLIMNHHQFSELDYNSFSIKNVISDSVYYLEFEVPENAPLTHFSIMSENEGGIFDIWDKNSKKLTNKYYYYDDIYNYNPYNDSLSAGKYYIRINNNLASIIHLNLGEVKLLDPDNKGKVQFTDTLQLYKPKIYPFYGTPGDGFQVMLKKVEGAEAPTDFNRRYYQLAKKENTLNVQGYFELSANSLDSTILYETSAPFTGTHGSEIWVLAIMAESAGIYDFNFNFVKAGDSITVDDDFAQYPGAQTSSLVAAGYAVKDGGIIQVANGNYNAYFPVTVTSDNVQLTGQEKENVHINNVYDYSYNEAIDFESEGGTISNLTVCSGPTECKSMQLANNYITIDNVDIEPLAGKSKVHGILRGSGTNLIIKNLSFTNANFGLNIGSENGLVENCTFNTDRLAIQCAGNNFTVKKNNFEIKLDHQAISVVNANGSGNCLIDSNSIFINNTANADYAGIIEVEEMGLSDDNNTSYIRNNTIHSLSPVAAIYAKIGNPPSKIIIENNMYKSDFSTGGKALLYSVLRSDGTSGIIARNNIFDGLSAQQAIYINGVDEIDASQRFAIYNNNFRMAPGATQSLSNNFITARGYNAGFTGIANLYLVNNIFEGNGFSYLIKCETNFSLYASNNIIYNFSKKMGTLGSIIGVDNDTINDPLFIDNSLHIDSDSPAIDNGVTPDEFPYIPEIDREGIIRPQGDEYDIGAYEQ